MKQRQHLGPMSARTLSGQGTGPTIIVSPLLALMRNQIAAAQRVIPSHGFARSILDIVTGQ